MEKNTSMEYLLSILPKIQDEFTLFIYYDAVNQKLLSTFDSAFNIIRYFWKEHTKYAIESDYMDPAAYLLSRIKQMQYTAPQEYLNKIADKKITDTELKNLSFLFMTNHCAISQQEAFGYLQLPQQRPLLIHFLNNIGYTDNTTAIALASSIINKTATSDYSITKC